MNALTCRRCGSALHTTGAHIMGIRDADPADRQGAEALAKLLVEHEPQQNPDATAYYRAFAEGLLASDWLVAVRRKAGADALTDAAADWWARGDVTDKFGPWSWLRDRAARIAREPR